ncbi:MAG TPA: NYN domain-containing protein [Gemmatimonadaceae bacterium]|nr:NYN domain-containing protein [Gemmatimonadaceae bacterium]
MPRSIPGADAPIPVAAPLPSAGDVAILIDWENLKRGLREHFRAAPNITSLIAAAREHGRLVIARAYADWTQAQLAIDAPNLYRAGIEPAYAQGRCQHDGAPVKNSADVRLAVDTVALCSQLPHVRTYVLVTGDGDLVHPLTDVRLQGHRVVVIAVSATMSALLESAADVVLRYERDVEPLERVVVAVPERGRPLPDAMDRLRRWLPFVLAGARAKQSFTSLNELLLQRFSLNARDYGMTFKQLMLEAAKQGMVLINTEGSMDFAILPGRGPADAQPGADEREAEQEQGDAYQGDVRFEHLEPDDQRRHIAHIDELESTSRSLTVTYLVDRIGHSSVLPMLSETQLKGLLLKAIDSGIFDVRETPAISPRTGEEFMRRELQLNHGHSAVVEALTGGK